MGDDPINSIKAHPKYRLPWLKPTGIRQALPDFFQMVIK
jgi:hypothetical protein